MNILHGIGLIFDWIFNSTLGFGPKRLERGQEVRIVATEEPVGALQIIDYDPADSARLIRQGREDAERIMG
jgi:hypothetical protein